MFYYVSKAVWFFATPSNFLVGAVLFGLCLGWTRLGPWGLGLASLAALTLLLCGIGPFGSWLLLPLEDRFPPPRESDGPVEGIVVLGGAIFPNTSFARGELVTGEAAERLTYMADLARRYPDAKVVFTGGSAPIVPGDRAEADALEHFASVLGLDATRITFENKARNTYENAVFSKRVAAPTSNGRWLLVTSAWHMPRAVGCFRQAGFPVVPFPVDYRTAGSRSLGRVESRVTLGLDRLDIGAKEWVGLLAYWLSGRTDALFPGPSPSGPAATEIR